MSAEDDKTREARGADDIVQPFMVEASGLRGRLLRTGPVIDAILKRHDYPPIVAQLLGEMIALGGLMSAMLKYDGVFTLQASGEGVVRLVVVDFTSGGAVRGYAEYDPEALPEESGDLPGQAELRRLMGKGRMAYTVDHVGAKERYQGIVELEGESLADAIQHYFRQSEQVDSAVTLAVRRLEDAQGSFWRAGGLLLQRVAGEGGLAEVTDRPPMDVEDDWRRALILMASATPEELVAPDLTGEELLFRLFNEDGVRVFEKHPLADECRCSREKVEGVLASMPRRELAEMRDETGLITVTCQFCSTAYRFDDEALDALGVT